MKIKLRGLEVGEHTYDFEEKPEDYSLDKSIFSKKLYSNVTVDCLGKNYYIKIQTMTNLHFECDRCLDDILRNLSVSASLVYTEDSSLDPEHQEDDLHILPPGQDKADLTEDVRQALLLDLPMKHLCQDECKGLCSQCGINLNKEKCKCEEGSVDSRWQALEKLK